MAVAESPQKMDRELGSPLDVKDRVGRGGGYRHGNFRGISIEALNELLPFLGSGQLELMRELLQNLRWGQGRQAMPFPGQLPEPIPSLGGAGWAIGVALP